MSACIMLYAQQSVCVTGIIWKENVQHAQQTSSCQAACQGN